jgi:hypothetical protein
VGEDRRAERRTRAVHRAEQRRARTRDELVELDARYARVAAAAALEAVRRSARQGRRTA